MLASENDDVCCHPQYCVVPLVGHMLNCGCSIYLSGIRDGIVRSINAIRVFMYCHNSNPQSQQSSDRRPTP